MSDVARVAPAMTASEWALVRRGGLITARVGDVQIGTIFVGQPDEWVTVGRHNAMYADEFTGVGTFHTRERHAVAAAMLCSQPYGFVLEDIAALHHLSTRAMIDGRAQSEEENEADERVASLIQRIAALLPPR